MKLSLLVGLWGLSLLSVPALAEEKNLWTHESEASIIQVSGNTKSESTSLQQKTSYKFDLNTLTVSGRYLQSKSAGQETGKSWDASLRYERALSEKWAAFVQHGAESNSYAGYIQRDNTDLGGKYFFIKTEPENFFSELGLRSTKTLSATSSSAEYNTSGRLYVEYSKKLNSSVSAKLWAEYLPNFKDSEAWLLNYEPSMSVMLNQILSLKISYLVKHHEKVLTSAESKDDSTFTTSLVAKF